MFEKIYQKYLNYKIEKINKKHKELENQNESCRLGIEELRKKEELDYKENRVGFFTAYCIGANQVQMGDNLVEIEALNEKRTGLRKKLEAIQNAN